MLALTLLFSVLWFQTLMSAEYFSWVQTHRATDWCSASGTLTFDTYACDSTPGWGYTWIEQHPLPTLTTQVFGRFEWSRPSPGELVIAIPHWAVFLTSLCLLLFTRKKYGAANWGDYVVPAFIGLWPVENILLGNCTSAYESKRLLLLGLVYSPVLAIAVLALRDYLREHLHGTLGLIANGFEGPPPWHPGPRKRYFLRKAGRCPWCGYDVRASVARCPEFGLPEPMDKVHIYNR